MNSVVYGVALSWIEAIVVFNFHSTSCYSLPNFSFNHLMSLITLISFVVADW